MVVRSGVIPGTALESESSVSTLIAIPLGISDLVSRMIGRSPVACCCINKILPSASSIVYVAHVAPTAVAAMLDRALANHDENRASTLLCSRHCFGGVTSSVSMKTLPVSKLGKMSFGASLPNDINGGCWKPSAACGEIYGYVSQVDEVEQWVYAPLCHY